MEGYGERRGAEECDGLQRRGDRLAMIPSGPWCRIAVVPLLVWLLVAAKANAQPSDHPSLGHMVAADFKYFVDNIQLDVRDVVTSPLSITSEDSVFRSPRFYLVVAGVGALWGGSFALDQTMRSHLRHMSSSDADLLQGISYGAISASSAALYAYGFYSDDSRTRQYVLTGGEGAALATVANLGIKTAFGRLRPREGDHSHTAFFRGGRSFVSGEVTPMFGLAAGISESYDNAWYVAAPVYSLALLDGFGRMGHDSHWFSDVVGAGLLGWGTSELFFYLHKQHANEPERWRIFPMTASPGGSTRGEPAPTGIAFEYRWGG
jgi:membrane-associated phospholipid phosphatase